MGSRGYINRGGQEELLRGAAAAGLSAEHQANFIAGSDTVEAVAAASAVHWRAACSPWRPHCERGRAARQDVPGSLS